MSAVARGSANFAVFADVGLGQCVEREFAVGLRSIGEVVNCRSELCVGDIVVGGFRVRSLERWASVSDERV